MSQDGQQHDVVICGGGLAGLTLARQLRLAVPRASVAVVEAQARPLPKAGHKVGESTVEFGSRYLWKVLGLHDYLKDEHLLKNGLRFFSGAPGTPFWARTEIGPSESPIVPSYQLDRGKLENDLRAMLEDDGVTLHEGYKVDDIALDGAGPHRVAATGRSGDRLELTGRWVVDASGRRRLLQRKLGLGRPASFEASAAWFRIEGHLKVGDLVPEDEKRWHRRDVKGDRWLSTNHLMGPGYWVWLIPLSTGYTSVGIVTDHTHHAFTDYNRPERAIQWLRDHEPVLAARLEGVELVDFLVMHDYAYTSERVLSEDRWACVGEAGIFVDPLYSPGTDLIALANSLTVELVRRDLRDGTVEPERVAEYNRVLLGWHADLSHMLGNNGAIFPCPDVFAAKLWWDFFVYWVFMCPYYFRGLHQLPIEGLREAHALSDVYSELNHRAQALFEAWADLRTVPLAPDRPFVPLPMFPSFLADQHMELLNDRTPEHTLERLRADVAVTELMLRELALRALRGVGPGNAAELSRRLGMAEWGAAPDAERVAVEELPRRERNKRIPTIARDIERAMGRAIEGNASLSELLTQAKWGRPASVAPSPSQPILPRRDP